MSPLDNVRKGFRFGPFVVDGDTGELYKKRKNYARLTPQELAALVFLMEQSPKLVLREKVIAAVWGGKEPEYGLKNILWSLRSTLNDSKRHPRYIEVLPRRGIRFIAAVKKLDIAQVDPTEIAAEPGTTAQLVGEVLDYLDALAQKAAELPAYYPPHLTSTISSGLTGFDNIRQTVRVVEDHNAFEHWQTTERDRLLAEGLDVDRLAYEPRLARMEQEGEEAEHELRQAPEVVEWNEQTRKRFHRAVILGDPGFGKTWLLRYEARQLAREAWQALEQRTVSLDQLVLPILLHLSELAGGAGEIEETVVAVLATPYSQAFHDWVRQKLETEQCVILLDAWDEVPMEVAEEGQIVEKPGHRQYLLRRLERFAGSPRFSKPRLLMASRPAGYVRSPIPGVKELEILAWEKEQKEAFVEVWFGEEKAKGDTFLDGLRENHQIRGLARIPLMLALMCRAYQEGRLSVPTRRSELYDCCLRGLLRDWLGEKQRREISDAYVDAQLELLQLVAHDLFHHGYEQFSESLLRDIMVPKLEQLKPGQELYSRPATSVIRELKNNGILTKVGEYGEKRLIFLHRTFHEYLAAGGLAEKLKGKSERAWVVADRKAWDPEWEPIIVYLAARLGDIAVGKDISDKEDRNRGLRRLKRLLGLLSDKRNDDYFRHRLALAAQCLPEIPPKVQLCMSHEMGNITRQAVKLWYQYAEEGTSAAVPHLTQVLPALWQVNAEVEKGLPLVAWLTSGVNARQKIVIQMAGQVGPAAATPEILHGFIELLGSWDRGLVVEPFAAFGDAAATPDVLHALLQLLQGKDWYSRLTAAHALGGLGSAAARPDIVDALLGLLRDGDWHLRVYAADALAAFGSAATRPDTITTLLELLRNQDWYLRLKAVKVLVALDSAAARPDVISALLELLRDEQSALRSAATEALVALGGTASLAALFGLLRDERPVFRSASAEALGVFGSVAPQTDIVDALLELLHDEDGNVRATTARALGDLGSAAARPDVLDELLELLRDESTCVRERAVLALGRLGSYAGRPDIVDALLERVRDVDDVAATAAKALGRLGSAAARPDVLDAFLELLQGGRSIVQVYVSEALAAFGSAAARPDIVAALQERLRDENWNLQLEAANALVVLGSTAARPDIVAALLGLLRHEYWQVRLDAAYDLARLGSAAAVPEIVHILTRWLRGTIGEFDEPGVAAKVIAKMAYATRFFEYRNGQWIARTIAELSHER